MNAPTKFIVLATIYLMEKQKEIDYIPDYCINELVKRFWLSGDVFREIRDLIQDENSHFKENDVFREAVAKLEAIKPNPPMEFGEALKIVHYMATIMDKDLDNLVGNNPLKPSEIQDALEVIGEYIGEHFTDLPWELE